MGQNTKKKGAKGKTTVINDTLTKEALQLPEIITQSTCWKAYHLDHSLCLRHISPNPKIKNCRENPYCIHRLGLEKIEKVKNQQDDQVAPDLVRRDLEKQPCGLVNFGNFCYVNSFLQIWYNDLVFRQCVYNWRSDPDFQKTEDSKMDVQAVMNTMQNLFLAMQFTPYETTNALDLIHLLKLDNEQHDVQEFNTLFFDALDRNLECHPNGEAVRRVIQSRFESRIRQTIKCELCGAESNTESEYRSLQISIEGHNSLASAIDAFFSPESLTDYKCEVCRRSGCVTRYSRFSKLPPILILQFNRYVFDSNGRHKKLKTPIQYLRTMSEKVLKPDSTGTSNYDLCAVMIHEGPNTHCGHYYDLIKSPTDDQWFTYNDKHVIRTKPPGVSVERESIQRATPDMKECYALIYQRDDSNDGITLENMQLPLLNIVNDVKKNLNDKFLKESKDGDASLNLWKSQVETRHKFLTDLWNDLEVKDGNLADSCNVAFLPVSLLQEVLSKEYKAIKEMRSIEDYTPPSPVKQRKDEAYNTMDSSVTMQNGNKDDEMFDGLMRSNSFNENVDDCIQLYSLERLNETCMSLCVHNKVSIISIFKGEVKAVMRKAAERLLKYYQIQLKIDVPEDFCDVPEDSLTNNFKGLGHQNICRLITGNDICVDCVKTMQKEANFKQNLEKTLKLPVMKEVQARTYNPSINSPPDIPPPKNSFWVFQKHLIHFKKLALDQFEYAKKIKQSLKQLVFIAHNAPERLEKKDSSSPSAEMESVFGNEEIAVGQDDNFAPSQPSSSNTSTSRKRKINHGAAEREVGSNGEEEENSEDDANEFVSCYDMKLLKQQNNGGLYMNGHGENLSSPSKAKRMIDYVDFLMQADNDTKACGKNIQKNGCAERLSSSYRTRPSYANSPTHLHDNEFLVVLDDDNNNTNNHCQNNNVNAKNHSSEDNLEKFENGKLNGGEYDRNPDDEIIVCSPSKPTNEKELKKPAKFNDKLYCEHNALTFRVSRTWISEEEWKLLRENFFDETFFCDPISTQDDECEICISEFHRNQDQQDVLQRQVDHIYKEVGDIFRAIDRRLWHIAELGIVYTRVICVKVIHEFTRKKRIKSNVEIPRICQECLLCEHERPYLILTEHSNATGAPVTMEEWRKLTDVFDKYTPYGRPHEIHLNPKGEYDSMCLECNYHHIVDEDNKRFYYPDGAEIYIKLKIDEDDDKEVKSVVAVTTRRLAAKSLLKFKMRSTDKVVDLKIKIYEKIKCMPNDQLLYLNGISLENDYTLEQARVDPNNIENPLMLIVQQPVNDASNGAMSNEPRQLEKGFRDTALSI